MNQYKTISDLKDTAKEKLTGKYGIAVFANFIPQLATILGASCLSMIFSFYVIFSMITGGGDATAAIINPTMSTGQTIALYLLTELLSIVLGVFNTGICLFFLNVACGRTASVANLFYGFRYMFKKSLFLSAVTGLVNIICLLPYNIFYILFKEDFSTQWVGAMVISLLVGLIIYTPISLALSQSFFLLLDFPQYSGPELLAQSIRIMKGHKRKLFLIQISFWPLMLLSVLTLGIGDLWLLPYTNMTMTLYFLDLMTPKAETGTSAM